MKRTNGNGSTKLAQALAQIATADGALASKADYILSIVKTSGLGKNLDSFNTAVREAYAANGWQTRPGRPDNNEPVKERVPVTVKQYVSKVRAAIRLSIGIDKMDTFGQLRSALAQAQALVRPTVPEDPRLEGVKVAHAKELIGAPFHDLIAVYRQLPATKKSALAVSVTRLTRQFEAGARQLHLVQQAA